MAILQFRVVVFRLAVGVLLIGLAVWFLWNAWFLDWAGCTYGNREYCYALGERYKKGRGLKKDVRAAFVYFQKSCAGGDGIGCTEQAFLPLPFSKTTSTPDLMKRKMVTLTVRFFGHRTCIFVQNKKVTCDIFRHYTNPSIKAPTYDSSFVIKPLYEELKKHYSKPNIEPDRVASRVEAKAALNKQKGLTSEEKKTISVEKSSQELLKELPKKWRLLLGEEELGFVSTRPILFVMETQTRGQLLSEIHATAKEAGFFSQYLMVCRGRQGVCRKQLLEISHGRPEGYFFRGFYEHGQKVRPRTPSYYTDVLVEENGIVVAKREKPSSLDDRAVQSTYIPKRGGEYDIDKLSRYLEESLQKQPKLAACLVRVSPDVAIQSLVSALEANVSISSKQPIFRYILYSNNRW